MISTADGISALAARQREFFSSGKTLDVKTRLCYLKALRDEIKADLDCIHAALLSDLGKSASESYMCETGLALCELNYMIKHLKRLAKPRRAKTPIAQAVSKSYRLPSPYGSVLVLSPWNYPFLLSVDPLVDAIAAGNTVMLKTGSAAPETGAAIKRLIEKVFPPEYATVVLGGDGVNDALSSVKFDYIFFTGSKNVGAKVYANAAKTLTPVTLELGGKSPCIVDETAKLPLAAKRIVWGKFLNLGQTCVAPDYILCAESVRDRLVDEIKRQITRQFGSDPLKNPSYGRMVNRKRFDRVLSLIDGDKLACGGESDEATLKIAPTVMINVTEDDAVMGEEIFGPVLPVLTYKSEEDILSFVSKRDAPLALYIFSSNKKRIKRLTTSLGFGGGCVNDVVIHLATTAMPFGGFGASGLGSYHGRAGFETFSHFKSIVDKKTWIDLPMRYQPYTKRGDRLVKSFLK